MGKICIALSMLTMLAPAPLQAQEIFIEGDNPAAAQARINLEKTTHYKSSLDIGHAILIVNRESWSPDFVSPVTVAITMRLMSLRGELLWSKTQPTGSRPEEVVVQDLLRGLAKAAPKIPKDENPFLMSAAKVTPSSSTLRLATKPGATPAVGRTAPKGGRTERAKRLSDSVLRKMS